MNILGKISTAVLLVITGIGATLVVTALVPWLVPWAHKSQSESSLVVTALECTEEVSLLSVGVQGITEARESAILFGFTLPGGDKARFIQYEFDLKLRLDGSQVEIAETGDHSYSLTIPGFIVIGNSQPHSVTAVEDNGIINWATADVDELDTVNEVLNADELADLIAYNWDLLEDQTKLFYGSIIRSIDPTIEVAFVFTD